MREGYHKYKILTSNGRISYIMAATSEQARKKFHRVFTGTITSIRRVK